MRTHVPGAHVALQGSYPASCTSISQLLPQCLACLLRRSGGAGETLNLPARVLRYLYFVPPWVLKHFYRPQLQLNFEPLIS